MQDEIDLEDASFEQLSKGIEISHEPLLPSVSNRPRSGELQKRESIEEEAKRPIQPQKSVNKPQEKHQVAQNPG